MGLQLRFRGGLESIETPSYLIWVLPSKRPSRDAQVHVRVDVTESNTRVLSPEVTRADDLPVITTVSFALLVPVARDLLVAGQWTTEVMRVQVLVGANMVQTDDGPTGHWLSSLAVLVHLALDSPVAVHVILQLGCGYGLLSGSTAVLHVMGV